MSIARFWCRICGDRILYRNKVKDPNTKQYVCSDCATPQNPWINYKTPATRDPRPVRGNLGRPVEDPDAEDQTQLTAGFRGILS